MTNGAHSRLTDEQKLQARVWIDTIKADVAACDSRNKDPKAENWGGNISKEIDYGARLEAGFYDKGIALICGLIRGGMYNGKYISVFDFDTLEAFQKFCDLLGVTLEQLAKWTRVEWHQNPGKIHVFFITSKPFKNVMSGKGLEIYAQKKLVFVSPSVHRDGNPYQAYDTESITMLDKIDQMKIEAVLEAFMDEFGCSYMDDDWKKQYIEYLEKPDTILTAGQRHYGLKTLASSWFNRYLGEWDPDKMSDEQRLERLLSYNNRQCSPQKPESEVLDIWEWVKKTFTGKRQEQRDKLEDEEEYNKYSGPEFPELKGNTFYQINAKPAKFIISYKQNKQLIEATVRISKDDNNPMLTQYLHHNKTYLTCIPTKIVRHKNPLTFLDAAAKYTISFVDAAGEHTTFSHKTLGEILFGLRDLGYVLNDGAEGALGAMVQAFKENKLIEDNEDMDFTGFFTIGEGESRKIIPSNVEIKEVVMTDLEDSLKFIEELAPYYEGRLDLLSTLIQWGMIAPAIFMLKGNNYFLKWFHFYGFPNATKSNSGKIVLGIDGHQDNHDFILNIARIDTIARLGDILSHTTFPKLVDEADLNGPEKAWLVNSIKSAIEGKIARSKFLTNRSTSSTPIPALSPLILTSNPPPPFSDSGYMRKVIDRNFAKSESYLENSEKAIKFKEFMRTDLRRERHLGEFRNWFIMNNQSMILDETRPLPLDLGLKILTAAYEKVGRKIPEWFKLRLPENQLEESIGDNSVIVKRAFETYIDTAFNHSLQFFRMQDPEAVKLPDNVSGRLVKLIDSNLLPDVKRNLNHDIIIRKGIQVELYKYGVTRDQLPNLRALADYIGAEFVRVHPGNKVVKCTGKKIEDYFNLDDKEEEDVNT